MQINYDRKQKSDIVISRPSAIEVEKYLKSWNNLKNYKLQEDALDKLFFKLLPRNEEISDILLKVATLNDFYSTNIFSVYPVAEHILSLKIDERLRQGDATLVNEIQNVAINGVTRKFYSFSTKYCSHHNPKEYPIYDSYVEKVLKYFRKTDKFSKFKNADLKDYQKFKNIIIAFREYYDLEEFNLKEIDQYLWQLGKEYFPNKYQRLFLTQKGNLMSYKFLLFDLDHTLLDFDTAEDIALTHFLEEQGVAEIQTYKDYYIPMNKGLWRNLEQGKITKPELVNTRFSRLFSHFGIEKDGAELAFLYQQHIAQQGQTYAGASELLDSLTAADYEIYGATNGITAIQTGRMAHSDISPYFNHIFISEKMGTQKPEAQFYEKIAEQIPDFDLSQTLMIGDSLTADIAGANNAGLDSIWYNPKQLENESLFQPTYIAYSYDDIIRLLVP